MILCHQALHFPYTTPLTDVICNCSEYITEHSGIGVSVSEACIVYSDDCTDALHSRLHVSCCVPCSP